MSENRSNNADLRPVVIEHSIPPEGPRPSSPAVTLFTIMLMLLIFLIAVIGIVTHWSAVVDSSSLVMLVLIGATVLCIPLGIAAAAYHQFRKSHLHLEHTRVDLEMKQEQLAAVQDERLRANERHAVELLLMQTRLAADERGNRPYLVNPSTQQVTEVTSGNYMQPVPAHYHFDYRPELMPGAATPALPAAFDMRIPSFAEAVASGDISPRQRDMLFSYELVEDDMTGQVQSIAPIRGEIGSQHTQFIVAGSQSGKTTYMSGIVAQAVAMRTVLYVIDPHKKHPEKSLAARLAALHPWMILPPASTHEEIRRLLDHATRTRDSLIAGETLFEGYHVMFLVDEVPALMAYQRSQEKPIRQLYTELALFMQSIGTQTAKFGMTGLFASQFATKEALGEIDFRDSCMSQFIMRLHPTQAQAMRILGKERVNAIPKFPKGHGFLLLSDSTGDPLRVAAGNVTLQDLTIFAGQLPPSPLPFATRVKEEVSDVAGASYRQPFTHGEWDFPGRHDARIVAADALYTDALHGQPANVMPFRKSSAELPVEPTTGASGERQQQEYLLSDQEITGFLAAYKVSYNIDKALAAVGRGSSRYRPAARRVIAAYGLREEA